MSICLIFLVLFGAVGGLSISPSSQNEVEFYVTPTPPPNPDCPKDKPCHTLNEYALNSQNYFGNESKVSLLFLDGYYTLASGTNLEIKDKNILTMVPVSSNSVSIALGSTEAHSISLINMTQLSIRNISFEWNLVTEFQSAIQITDVHHFYGNQITVMFGKLIFTDVNAINLVESDINPSLVTIDIIRGATNPYPANINITECRVSDLSININVPEVNAASLNPISDSALVHVNMSRSHLSDISLQINAVNVDVILKENIVAPINSRSAHSDGIVMKIAGQSQVQLEMSDSRIFSYILSGVSVYLNHSELSVHVHNTNVFETQTGFIMDAENHSNLSMHVHNTNVFETYSGFVLNTVNHSNLSVHVHYTTVFETRSSGFIINTKEHSFLDAFFDHCTVTQSTDAVFIKADLSTVNVTFDKCEIVHQSRDGLSFTFRSTSGIFLVRDSNITDNSRSSIQFDVGEKSNITTSIIDTILSKNSFGLELDIEGQDWEQNILIQNCTFSDSAFGIRTKNIIVKLQGNQLINLLIVDSRFVETNFWGVFISEQTFQQMNVTLQNCIFHSNKGYALEIDSTAVEHLVLIENCHFEQNTGLIIKNLFNFPNSTFVIKSSAVVGNLATSQELPIIQLIGLTNVNIENCIFADNIGTPLELSFIDKFLISGNNMFTNNSGFQGGALSLLYSQLHLANNTIITFQNNSAVDVGGAMYVQQEASPVLPAQCFYQVPTTDDVNSLNILLHFKNNKAGRGGNHIYGAALHDNCDIQTTNSGVPSRSVDHFEEFFHFEQSSSNLSLVSSDPQRVCLCESTGQPACANLSYILIQNESRYPGEKFNLSTVVVGDEFGTLSSTVYANFLQTEAEDHVGLNSLQDSQTVDYQQCSTLTYSVHSRGNLSVVLVLKINQAKTNTYGDRYMLKQSLDDYHQSSVIPSILLTTPIFINITLLVCPLGFEISGDPPSCDCNSFLRANNVHNCSIQSHEGSIVRSGTQWLGTLSLDNHTEVILTQYCKFGYCKSETLSINFDNSDKQCSNGRSGVLCGACMNNLSQILGSSECRHCTDNSYLALLIVFAISGFALVLFIKLLDFTVAKGTINGLIFYANIVWANQNIILSTERHPTVIGQILKVFLAWLNLDFGINTCFFVGLNAYWKTWLQFVFPIYIWVIAGFIIIISHNSIKASRLFGNNSIPMLATLLLLSYSKLLRTIITVLSPTHLQYSDGYLTVWTEDGTIPYLSSVHAALFSVALFCLVFLWAPFMITLLFIQPLKRFDHLKPLRWINKWKPLFDAYTGPLKDKYLYWVGVLLLARGIILVTSTITSAMVPRVNLLVMAIITAILGLHANVYKKWYLSLLEKSFLLNLSLLACGLLYIDIIQDTESRLAIAYTSVGIAFLQFICIVSVHVVCQLKNCRQQKHVMPNRQGYREIEPPARNHEGEDYREPLIENSGVY